jgi:hypothetical protein
MSISISTFAGKGDKIVQKEIHKDEQPEFENEEGLDNRWRELTNIQQRLLGSGGIQCVNMYACENVCVG